MTDELSLVDPLLIDANPFQPASRVKLPRGWDATPSANSKSTTRKARMTRRKR